MLKVIKAQQDVKREPEVQTNSEKICYKKQPRKLYGSNYKTTWLLLDVEIT